MSFKIAIPERVERTVTQWELPSEVEIQFYSQLDSDLTELPSEGFPGVDAPVRFLRHRFVVTHNGTTYRFIVMFNDGWEEEGTRIVLDCYCLH